MCANIFKIIFKTKSEISNLSLILVYIIKKIITYFHKNNAKIIIISPKQLKQAPITRVIFRSLNDCRKSG